MSATEGSILDEYLETILIIPAHVKRPLSLIKDLENKIDAAKTTLEQLVAQYKQGKVNGNDPRKIEAAKVEKEQEQAVQSIVQQPAEDEQKQGAEVVVKMSASEDAVKATTVAQVTNGEKSGNGDPHKSSDSTLPDPSQNKLKEDIMLIIREAEKQVVTRLCFR